jgi:hypothetical protein
MIAPTHRRRKGPRDGRTQILAWRTGPKHTRLAHKKVRHGIVSGIIILPNFRQATAALNCDNESLRWPGPFDTGFLSPQPPGVAGIGPFAE